MAVLISQFSNSVLGQMLAVSKTLTIEFPHRQYGNHSARDLQILCRCCIHTHTDLGGPNTYHAIWTQALPRQPYLPTNTDVCLSLIMAFTT